MMTNDELLIAIKKFSEENIHKYFYPCDYCCAVDSTGDPNMCDYCHYHKLQEMIKNGIEDEIEDDQEFSDSVSRAFDTFW